MTTGLACGKCDQDDGQDYGQVCQEPQYNFPGVLLEGTIKTVIFELNILCSLSILSVSLCLNRENSAWL